MIAGFVLSRASLAGEGRKAAVAAVVVLLFIGWWRWRSTHPVVITAHNHIVADFRNRLTLRGDQGSESGNGPLVFERGFDDVSFYLPEGSRAGRYAVAAFREDLGVPLATATGLTTIEKGVTKMIATLDLSHVRPSHCLLGVRRPGVEWAYYPMIVI